MSNGEKSNYLTTHRFSIEQESVDLMRKVEDEMMSDKDLKVKGVAFFGSRTKGLSSASSDLDMVIFYDGERFPVDNIVRKHEQSPEWIIAGFNNKDIEAKIAHENIIRQKAAELVSKEITVESVEKQMGSVLAVDLSRNNIDSLIKYYQDFSWAHDTYNFKLVSFFLLGVGEEVYKAREYILSRLESERNPYLFNLLMTDLSRCERPTLHQGGKSELVPSKSYPKTIAEAREYFLTRR